MTTTLGAFSLMAGARGGSLGFNHRRIAGGQRKRKTGTALRPVRGCDSASVRLDDGPANCQAEPDPWFGGFARAAYEHFKNVRAAAIGDARPIVADGDLDRSIQAACGN